MVAYRVSDLELEGSSFLASLMGYESASDMNRKLMRAEYIRFLVNFPRPYPAELLENQTLDGVIAIFFQFLSASSGDVCAVDGRNYDFLEAGVQNGKMQYLTIPRLSRQEKAEADVLKGAAVNIGVKIEQLKAALMCGLWPDFSSGLVGTISAEMIDEAKAWFTKNIDVEVNADYLSCLEHLKKMKSLPASMKLKRFNTSKKG